jgi:hypothetical protein
MKLAEALAERADATRRVEQLRTRIAGSARYQEGEAPAEDAAALLADDGRGYRQLRSELKIIPALSVADLRAQADELGRQIREVDTLIQRTNWEADLLD